MRRGTRVEPEGLGETANRRALRRGFGQPPAERLAGVLQRVVDQVLLLAALRHADRDLAAGLGAERLGQQFLLLDVARQQDGAGDRLVVVELGEERAQHLAGLQRRIGLREIGAVAPVLAGPEEEHLDAGLPAFLVDGEDVGLVDAPAC